LGGTFDNSPILDNEVRMSKAPSVEQNNQAAFLVEYQAAQQSYLHYDAFRWQSGTFLIAGVFAFWGFLISADTKWLTPTVVSAAIILVTALMALWMLYAHHYRQIYLCKLNRIHELEGLLEMKQHRRFSEAVSPDLPYHVYGPKGHILDFWVFFVTSLGGPLIGFLRVGFDPWLFLPVPVVLIVLFCVMLNERRIKKDLANRASATQL
jgi:hypothetical protein